MSNPNDPKPTNPEKKPTDADKAAEEARQRGDGGSSYEFDFPGEVKSYSDLPPVAQPEAPDAVNPALPPRPSARQPSMGSFDFIDLDADVAAMSNPDIQLPAVPPAVPPTAPVLTPTPNAVNLPPQSRTSTPLGIDLPPEPPATPVLTPTPHAVDLPPVAPPADDDLPLAEALPAEVASDLPADPLGLTPTPNAVELPPEPVSEAPRAAPTDAASGHSSYEFEFSGDVKSFSDLPPVAQSDSSSDVGQSALPPRPEARTPTAGSFDFIDLDSAAAGSNPDIPAPPAPAASATDKDFGLPPAQRTPSTNITIELPSGAPTFPAPPEPLFTPTSDAVQLPPEQPNVPTAVTMSSVDFDLGPVPDASPSSSGTEHPVGFAASAADIDLHPSEDSGRAIPTGIAASMPDVNFPLSHDDLPTLPVADAFTASSTDIDLDAQPQGPLSGIPTAALASSGDVDFSGVPQAPASDIPSAFAASGPDIDLVSPPQQPASEIPSGILTESVDIDLAGSPQEPRSEIPSGILAGSGDVDLSGTAQLPASDIPDAFAASGADIDLSTPPQAADGIPSGILASSVEFDLPTLEEKEPAVPTGFAASVPEIDLPPVDAPEQRTIPTGWATSTPDIDLGEIPPLPPIHEPEPMLPTVPQAFTTSSSMDVDLSATEASGLATIPTGFAASVPDFDLGEIPPLPPIPDLEPTVPAVPEGFAARSSMNVDLSATETTGTPTIPSAFAASSADIELGDLPDVPTAQPASDTLNVAELASPPQEPASDTRNVAELGTAPPKAGDEPDSAVIGHGAPLPLPQTPSDPSMSSILLPAVIPNTDPSMGTGPLPSMAALGSMSVPDISILYPAEQKPTEPPADPGAFAAGEHAIAEMELPPVAPGATDSSVGLGQMRPVTPSTAWLDSEIFKKADAEGASGQPATKGEPTEGSDIWSGQSAPTTTPTELSDVIAATAYAPTGPTEPDIVNEPARPSDVALTFDGPPGGSTIPSGDSHQLPIAESASDSDLLGSGTSDSIHDLEDPDQNGLLIDSARLAEAPDLPPTKATEDAPDYGAAARYSPDASSILADLSSPNVDVTADSSSVRVEAPGMGRTLASPPESNFDLTVPEEAVPTFGEPDEPTDWQSQAGSDLFSDRTATDPELVEPVDADLMADQPSLTSAPSSIFSGGKTPALEPTDPDFDQAEFSPRPTGAAAPVDDEGAVDWDAVDAGDEATRGIPKDASLSAVMRELADDANQTQDAVPVIPGADQVDDEGNPVVSVDWMAGSGEEQAILEPEKTVPAPKKGKPGRAPEKDFTEKPTKPSKAAPAPGKAPAGRAKPAALVDTGSGSAEVAPSPARAKDKPAKKGGGMLVGVLLGGLVVGGGAAGAYFADLLPARGPAPVAKVPDKTQPNDQNPTTAAGPSANTALLTGNVGAALKRLPENPTNAEEKATDGAVRTFAAWQTGSNEELRKARVSLQAVLDDADAAKTPEGEKQAALAAVRLGVTHQLAGDKPAARKLYQEARAKYPNYAPTFEALLSKMDVDDGGPVSLNGERPLIQEEALRLLLVIAVLMPDETPKAEEPEEAGTFYWKAVKLANEKKYDEAIALLKKAKEAHIKRAKAKAGLGLNPFTDPLEEMFPRSCDEMAAAWKLMDQLYRHPATADAMKAKALPKALDALAQAGKDLDAAKKDAETAKKDAKDATDKLKVAETDLKTANDKLKVAGDTVTKLEGDVAKFDKDRKEEKKLRTDAEGKIDVAVKEKMKAEAVAADRDKLIAAIAAELKPAKVLPDKPTDADLVKGVKTVADLASGTDAQAVVKARKEAEEAKQKLDTETKRLTKKYDDDTKQLKDDLAAAVKKGTDEKAEAVKQEREKAATEKKKQDDAHAAALATEKAATAAAKKETLDQKLAFQKQSANLITPAQAVDLWLPVLTDLRRPTDAEPASAVARKSLESSVPGSEDEAKAQTAIGMALLLKNDLAGARVQFQAARRGEAYKAAAAKGTYWTKVADNGLEATEDPLALYRMPVTIPPVDTRAATKSLDAGILAYKRGDYEKAAAALADAAKSDPSDPVTWYYLGAARWATGDEGQAKKDIAQGGEREAKSVVPGRVVSAALAPIQGAARDAIDKVRP